MKITWDAPELLSAASIYTAGLSAEARELHALANIVRTVPAGRVTATDLLPGTVAAIQAGTGEGDLAYPLKLIEAHANGRLLLT